MDLRWVDASGVDHAMPWRNCPSCVSETTGSSGSTCPVWSVDAERVLAEEFGFHPMAIAAARERNHIPRIHVYADHVFLVIHAPEIGEQGHVHYLELDQFIGRDFLVTVHGPLNPVVPLEAALQETRQVIGRIEAGRLRPTSPFALTYAIVSTIVRRESALVAELARQVGLLEQRVMAAVDDGSAEVPDRPVHRTARAADHPHHGLTGR